MPDWSVARIDGPLFGPDLPDGFRYRDDLITTDDQSGLVSRIQEITFADFEMRGVVARRRVAFFGASYDKGTEPHQPIPGFLLPLRATAAAWAGADPETFLMALINEYRPGSPIGWHRDAPQYGTVLGISLMSACRMRFRPYVSPQVQSSSQGRRKATHEILLQPRSVYVMSGEARQAFEHSIPPVTELRYSVTFRTLRPK
jgi:alkylated DNA repair dioxygenase AlkB